MCSYLYSNKNIIIMLNWKDVIKYANHGNPTPDKRVEKSEVEWKSQLTPEEYRVTRQKGTEPRFSGSIVRYMRQVFIIALVVIPNYLIQVENLILVLVGQVLISQQNST